MEVENKNKGEDKDNDNVVKEIYNKIEKQQQKLKKQYEKNLQNQEDIDEQIKQCKNWQKNQEETLEELKKRQKEFQELKLNQKKVQKQIEQFEEILNGTDNQHSIIKLSQFQKLQNNEEQIPETSINFNNNIQKKKQKLQQLMEDIDNYFKNEKNLQYTMKDQMQKLLYLKLKLIQQEMQSNQKITDEN